MDDFKMITRLDAIGQRGACVYVGLRKSIVNQGIETSFDIHLVPLPIWLWMAPEMLEFHLDENDRHLEEMGFTPIADEDRAKIRAALPLG